ncbi:hypothetical protein JMJ77_0005140 [Colletotrichum scovillei]|uniref:Uncharacterized protein n=1 Tax=Colletotrichum scovillei TaxID=1209932 RepID=A0A9P7UKB1_9PEZI|nr:hypothetical protein JMJ77_0005140 [Colletotrichum scovillei]KAG7076353.1 hypothetical protein JMJ76_0013618 [Colletotrichum scovillei]KAG7083405.1 hypothetical protein JMJ78_0008851 [Colletotrichum scovillei]
MKSNLVISLFRLGSQSSSHLKVPTLKQAPYISHRVKWSELQSTRPEKIEYEKGVCRFPAPPPRCTTAERDVPIGAYAPQPYVIASRGILVLGLTHSPAPSVSRQRTSTTTHPPYLNLEFPLSKANYLARSLRAPPLLYVVLYIIQQIKRPTCRNILLFLLLEERSPARLDQIPALPP